MKKFKIFLFLYLIIFVLSSCNTIKKGFKNPKKNSSDEFLVEKKSPLVMPPEFNELPIPNNKNKNASQDKNDIKELIKENKPGENNDSQNSDLEGSILEKIKN